MEMFLSWLTGLAVAFVVTLLLLSFMGDALRDALEPRKVDA